MRDETDHSGEVHGRLTLLSKNGNRQEYKAAEEKYFGCHNYNNNVKGVA